MSFICTGLDLLKVSIEKAGYTGKIDIGMDVAASGRCPLFIFRGYLLYIVDLDFISFLFSNDHHWSCCKILKEKFVRMCHDMELGHLTALCFRAVEVFEAEQQRKYGAYLETMRNISENRVHRVVVM